VNIDENGKIINIVKPKGWTSFKVVKHLKKYYKGLKVGHAGTLDPFASGILIVCVGKATKRVESVMDLEKEYIGEIELGKMTDTLDSEGKLLTQTKVGSFNFQQIEEVINGFKGEINQIPPMFSSLKVKGQRLYSLARKGIEIPRKPRKVMIYSIRVLSYRKPFITIRVVCSRGTYIRVLAQDIGEKLQCGAYLKRLIRNRIGNYRLKDSLSVDNFVIH